jgi:hypothetical protein
MNTTEVDSADTWDGGGGMLGVCGPIFASDQYIEGAVGGAAPSTL